MDNKLFRKLIGYNWDAEDIIDYIPKGAVITDCDDNYVYLTIDNVQHKMNVEGRISKMEVK